ncbi:MAG TPA: hypothetical protein VI078_14990 [bacterium]
MEEQKQAWEFVKELPQILDQYSNYSYPLLLVLLIGGLLILGIHLYRRNGGAESPSGVMVFLGSALCFLALGGFFLKYVGARQAALALERARNEFIAKHRAPDGEHWLMVFDFSLPPALSDETRSIYIGRIGRLVDSMNEILLEDLPPVFRQPRAVRVEETAVSPWQTGVGDENYDEIFKKLNAFEVMWGSVDEQGAQAKAFLGLNSKLAPEEMISRIPLRDFPMGEDLRRSQRFDDVSYYRLLGLVTLGMALDTYRRAQEATDESRRGLFLKAVQQMNAARDKVSNRRDDSMLQQSVYSRQVDTLIKSAADEAGVGQ